MQTNLGCQVCHTSFSWVHELTSHMRSTAHIQKMEDVFKKEKFSYHAHLPHISVIPLLGNQGIQPIIGLSMLTFCYSAKKSTFYLCHVCEEKCLSERIANHLSSADHCSNYFSYTHPNVLKFSWMANMDMKSILRPHIKKEVNINGAGQLQLLQLPENLMKHFEESSYSEVMRTLSENRKLLKLIEAIKPKRTMIQAYQRDSSREHPLLGMQHIVECLCVGLTERRHYLCTLCKLPVATHMIIKHVLSFDHIFSYFRAWHPSTLMAKECYADSRFLGPSILDFAKQSEEIHGTAYAEMRQVSLEPEKFASVNFTCFAEALEQLESITKKNGESSLIVSIKPGIKLVERWQMSVSAKSAGSSCKLRCQNCDVVFETVCQYLNHVPKPKHKQMLMEKFFIKGEGADQKGYMQDINTHLKKSLEKTKPAVGLSQVVMCISSEVHVKPIYVCFACEECFPDHEHHFHSRKHLIHTMRYQNPWRLPFAWENHLDVNTLKSLAWEDENERPCQMILKILDMPRQMFGRLILDYTQVMTGLVRQHTVLKHGVPQCETYRKLQQNERFPLLGEKFVVTFDTCSRDNSQATEAAFICFLCKRRLSNDEAPAHTFSREHVVTFLECYHPGSLNSSTDAVTLLDLAKQAARIHPASTVKVIKLKTPIWKPFTYERAKFLLESAVRRDGAGVLQPQIIPNHKLVPRVILKEENQGHTRSKSQENSLMTGEESKNHTSQKSPEKKTPAEVGAQINNSHGVESGKPAEKGANNETSSEKELEKRGKVFSETSSDKMMTCHAIKEEKIEEPVVKMPSKETQESCQNSDKAGGEEKTDTGHKWQLLTPKQEPSCKAAQILPSIKQKEVTTAEKGDKPSHQNEKDESRQDKLWCYVKRKSREPMVGLDALLECCCDQRDPIYFCECCSVKIPEKAVIGHVIGADHQKMYLVGSKKHSSPMGKHVENSLRHVAALYEQENGCGHAQVVDLDEETYSNVSKQNFMSAIRMVKAFKDSQDCHHGLLSTSTLSAVRSLDASVTLHAQHDVCSKMEQVVDMEIDAAEDSLTAAMSVMTENTSGAPKECVKMPQIKSESAGSAEEGSSLHMSTSGAKTPCLHPADIKAEVSNTTGGPLKIATTSKILGTPQYPDSAVKTSTKSMTAISKSATSTSVTIKSTTPNSSLTACSTSSKERETAHKCMATTSSATATITKCTADNHNPSTTVKIENASKYTTSKTVTQTMVASVKCESTEGSAKTILNSLGLDADVASNVPKSSGPAAPHPTGFMSVRLENKNPHTEPSCSSTIKAKPSKSCPKIGSSQLIRVRCKQKQQVYCQLCSVKVTVSGSEHFDDYSHKFNYVNKFAEGKDKLSQFESKDRLDKLVASLAERDKGSCHIQKNIIEVSIDVYEELAHLPQEIALERLKAMLKQRDLQDSSSSTTNTAGDVVFANSYGASSPDKGGGNLAAGHSDRAQYLKSSEPEANDQISDQLPSCPTVDRKEPEPFAVTPSIKAAEIAVNVKQEPFEPDVGTQTMVEVTPATESPAMKMEKPEGGTLATAACRFACTKTGETRQQQKRIDTKLLDEQNVGEDISPVKVSNPDLFAPAAPADTDQQNQSRPSQDEEIVPKHPGCSPTPGYHSPSQALPIVTEKRPQDFSMLSTFLTVKGLSNEPILGLGSVWECQGISLRTIFLCENCKEKIDISDICQHVTSTKHQLNYIQGSANKVDTQVNVLRLREDLHQRVEAAPFSEALELVQNMKKEASQSVLCPPISSPQQNDHQPDDHQSRAESLAMDKQPTLAHETDQRRGNEDRQKAEKQDLREPLVQRRVTSPLDVTRAVVSPLPSAHTRHLQPEFGPLISQQQGPVPESQVEQAQVCSKAPSPSVFDWSSSKTSQMLSVSPKQECHPTRKRPAVTPLEALVRPDPQIEDPLPAKCKCSTQQPVSQLSTGSTFECTPVNAPANSFPMDMQDKLSGSTSNVQGPPTVDWELYTPLIDLVRKRKKMSTCCPSPYNPGNPITSCDDVNSSAPGVEDGSDSKCVQTTATMAKKPKSSKMQYIEITLMEDPPPCDSPEENAVVADSSTDPCDPQHQSSVDPQSNVSQPRPLHCADHAPAQIPQLQGDTTTDSFENCKRPINAIITTRPDPDSYNRQDLIRMNRSHQVIHDFSGVAAANPNYSVAPSEGHGLPSQMPCVTNAQALDHLSSEAVKGHTTPDNLSLYSTGFFQLEGYTFRVPYPSQVYPSQVNLFGATPIAAGWMGRQMHEQVLQQQRQHHSSWPSAPAAAGAGQATNEAAYPGIASFTTPAYANIIIPMQNNNNVMTQNCPQVYINPLIPYPPTANNEISSQATVNPFSTMAEFFAVAPSMANTTPP